MSVQVEKLEKNMAKLTIELSAEQFEDAMKKAFNKSKNKFNIPGFRKGKAPRAMIEKMYGEGIFYEEAADEAINATCMEAMNESGLEIVSRPEVAVEQIGKDKPFIYTATVAVRPEVTLGEYKGVEVKKEHTLVTEDDVNAEIEKERNKQAAEVSVDDRAVAEGDTVNLDYSGSVDGVKFAGGTAEGQTLKIGSHTFIPGFEEQMVGMNIGEEKDLNVTFPTEYHAPDLAGKEAVFHVKVNSITETQLPALDDDFAKDISEFDTLDAYKADVRAKLEAQAAERDNNAFTNAVIEKVMANATVEIPDAMVERQIDSMVRNFEARLAQQGLKLADFMKYTGQDEKSFRNQYRDQAEKSVRANLVLEAVENVEKFEAAEEEIDAEIEKFAKQIGQNVEDLKKNLTEGDREYFKADVIRDKAVKFLCDNAKAE